ISRIPNDRRPPNVGRNLFKQLYPFTAQTVFKNHKACRAATRSVEPCDETRADWIGDRDEHNRQRAAGMLQRRHAKCASGEDDIRRESDQFGCVFTIAIDIILAPADVNSYVAAFGPTQLLQGLPEHCDVRLAFWMLRRDIHKHANAPNLLRLLRASGERPGGKSCNSLYEPASSHC